MTSTEYRKALAALALTHMERQMSVFVSITDVDGVLLERLEIIVPEDRTEVHISSQLRDLIELRYETADQE